MERIFVFLFDCVDASESCREQKEVFVQLDDDFVLYFALRDKYWLLKCHLHLDLFVCDFDDLERCRLLTLVTVLDVDDIEILHGQATVVILKDNCLIHS